jgi:heme a synthase
MRAPVAEKRAAATSPAASPAGSVQHRRFAVFAWGVLAYNVAVILWGALVRATGSGAGCGGHWPLCNGDVLPNIAQIGTAIELTHRVMSGLALLLVAAMFVWARKVYPAGHPARRWAIWSMAFILTEALLGASLVLLGHVARNDSVGRVYSLATHLINTFLLLGSLTLSAWSATGMAQRQAKPFSLSGLGPLVALVLVAVAGAITALGDTLFPAHTLAEGLRSDFSSTASFLIRLRIIHPVLAVAAGLLIAVAAVREYRANHTTLLRALSGWLLALFAVQVAVGGVSILLQAPAPIQLLHLLIADVIWITLVLFIAERRIA